ncbi:hypothetical protein [uncultured Winogradskyella sp.]|uniref:sodium:solute symporter family protein n=1 Tax=uncultured Winogradskyella sp. TaxID=395353 RepID=UPI0026382380|nr:hypothetical protein [uncultured Winogradskyella sp.]
MTLELIVLLIFSFVLVLYGWAKSSEKKPHNFSTEKKQLNLWQTTFGVFSVVGGGEFIYVTELSYQFGVFSCTLFLGFSIGCFLFLTLYKKVRQFNSYDWEKESKYDIHSIPDISFLYFNKVSSRISTVYMLLSLGALLLIQFALGGMMIEILTGFPQAYSIVLMSVIVSIYTIGGGFKSVLATDIVQIVVLFIAFIIMCVFFEPNLITDFNQNLSIINQTAQVPDLKTLSVLIIGGICWVFGGSDIWLRITSAKSNSIAKKSLIWNGIALIIFGILVAILGAKIAVANPNFEASNAFIETLNTINDNYLKIAVILGLFAGLVSTADTELHAISDILSKELWRHENVAISVKRQRLTMVFVSIVTVIIAIVFKDVLIDVYLVLLNVFIILGSYMLMTLLKRGNNLTSIISLSLSGIILIYIAIYPPDNFLYALLVALPPLVIMSFVKNQNANKYE